MEVLNTGSDDNSLLPGGGFPNDREALIGLGLAYVVTGRLVGFAADHMPTAFEAPVNILSQLYEYGGWGAAAIGACLEVKNITSRLQHR